MSLLEGHLQSVQDGQRARLGDAQRVGNRGHHQGGIADWGTLDKADAIGERAAQPGRHLHRQARFADTSRARQRQEAHIRALQEGTNSFHLALTPNERGQEGWESVHEAILGLGRMSWRKVPQHAVLVAVCPLKARIHEEAHEKVPTPEGVACSVPGSGGSWSLRCQLEYDDWKTHPHSLVRRYGTPGHTASRGLERC